MSDPAEALQIALYQRLSAELSVPVFDAVPMNTPYPYVTIGREIARNTSPLSGRKRRSRLIYLSVWSDYRGQLEVKRINAQIADALDGRPLQLAAGRAFGVRVLDTAATPEPDGVTYQGSVTVQIITTH